MIDTCNTIVLFCNMILAYIQIYVTVISTKSEKKIEGFKIQSKTINVSKID